MGYYCGIDIGASTAKLVIVDRDRRVLGRALRASGIDYSATAQECLNEALEQAGIDRRQIAYSLSTGYGRNNVSWADATLTEIACHGRGAHFHFPELITVIDIGAQDNKVINLDAKGRRTSFKMNRKCAAGTGAFLEEIALRLNLDVSQLDSLAEQSTKEVTLGSFCTVFAATEILGKIRAGERVEDIVKGAFRSVVKRIVEMDAIEGRLVMTGGVVAHNRLLTALAAEAFGTEASVPPEPQYIGAFGAALFAIKKSTEAVG
jgi:predicted CoA-substrate-specific enzyme activase